MTRIATEAIRPIWEKFFHAVDEGVSVLLTKNDVPIAEIRPVDPNGRKLRPRGLAAGEFELPDDFDDPLPEDIIKLFTLED
ncbi:MAG: type II toxin-antitoxin system Phd/YefM family antitoxin [Candidatus Kapaibacterium sp.]